MVPYSTSTSLSNSTVWESWNSGWTTSTSSVTSNDVWLSWNTTWASNSTATYDSSVTWSAWNNPRYNQAVRALRQQETDAERAAREERARIQREEQERAQRERDEANARARELLLSVLNEEQKEEYLKYKAFTVIAKDSQRRYIIKEGWAGNVYEVDENDNVIRSFCIHPRETIPVPDNLTSQKLMLEGGQEKEFQKIANITEYRKPTMKSPIPRKTPAAA